MAHSGRMGTRLIAAHRRRSRAQARRRARSGRASATWAKTPAAWPVSPRWECRSNSSSAADRELDVMIDFSLPEGSLAVARVCAERKIPLVVGTTGFDPASARHSRMPADRIPILIAPNMSRAVNLLMRLVREAARALGEEADIAIIERHHRTKKDAPSGTALRLAEFARQGLAAAAPRGQSQVGASRYQHALASGRRLARRAHRRLCHAGETIELSHRALNRDGFARGALDAAKFLAGKPAGLYSMEDVLGC